MSAHEHPAHEHPGQGHAAHEHAGHGQGHGTSDMGGHGMVVVGAGPVYLSHLPMFAPPHNFQVILEVELTKPGDDVSRVYQEDRETSGVRLYTLNPKPFALRELLSNFPDPPERTSFQGTLFRGHFERSGNVKLIADLTVNVLDVTYFSELPLPGDDPRPELPLTYRCFGRGSQRFLAHEIVQAPDFDQIVTMSFADAEVEAMEVVQGPVKIHDRADELDHRLRENETVVGFFFQSIGPQGQHGFTTDVTIGQEIYLESGELKG